MTREQTEVRCVLMRGGTSKALFFHETDVPAPGMVRDRFLKRAMGTPDVMQIDGLGGSHLVTSKIAIVRKSARDDADVDYTFVQVDVDRDIVDYEGNCGNISSAVGPFSIDEGLVAVNDPVTTVRIYNTNTDKHLVAKVQVVDGRAKVAGDCVIAGVPGSGAEILMDYAGTVGAKTGRLLPTGSPADTIALEDGRAIDVMICDVANPCVFVAATSLGLSGSELSNAIGEDRSLIETIGEIQSKAGERIGLHDDWRSVHLPALPLAAIVAPPEDYVDENGVTHAAASMDLRARLVFLGKCHPSMAGTGSMCLAAASRVPGSLVERAIGDAVTSGTLRIGHPLGVMEVRVDVGSVPGSFETLGLARTARRLMAGVLYVPSETLP